MDIPIIPVAESLKNLKAKDTIYLSANTAFWCTSLDQAKETTAYFFANNPEKIRRPGVITDPLGNFYNVIQAKTFTELLTYQYATGVLGRFGKDVYAIGYYENSKILYSYFTEGDASGFMVKDNWGQASNLMASLYQDMMAELRDGDFLDWVMYITQMNPVLTGGASADVLMALNSGKRDYFILPSDRSAVLSEGEYPYDKEVELYRVNDTEDHLLEFCLTHNHVKDAKKDIYYRHVAIKIADELTAAMNAYPHLIAEDFQWAQQQILQLAANIDQDLGIFAVIEAEPEQDDPVAEFGLIMYTRDGDTVEFNLRSFMFLVADISWKEGRPQYAFTSGIKGEPKELANHAFRRINILLEEMGLEERLPEVDLVDSIFEDGINLFESTLVGKNVKIVSDKLQALANDIEPGMNYSNSLVLRNNIFTIIPSEEVKRDETFLYASETQDSDGGPLKCYTVVAPREEGKPGVDEFFTLKEALLHFCTRSGLNVSDTSIEITPGE